MLVNALDKFVRTIVYFCAFALIIFQVKSSPACLFACPAKVKMLEKVKVQQCMSMNDLYFNGYPIDTCLNSHIIYVHFIGPLKTGLTGLRKLYVMASFSRHFFTLT